MVAYVGTYSSPAGSNAAGSHGKGIYLFDLDRKSGDLSRIGVVANEFSPSYLALHPSGEYLYSADTTNSYNGTDSGSVTAYRIHRKSRLPERLNTVSSRGARPTYLSVHSGGRYLLLANYAGGTIAAIGIESDGSLGAATCVVRYEGKPGPAKASDAPSGSFAASGHDRPHAHMVHADPSGRFVLSTDLGLDRIFVWKFDERTGVLSPHGSVSLPPGDGPRHFAFHPNRR